MTERGLARLLDISQPHAHHVIHGNRRITPGIFDLTMEKFGLNVLDLCSAAELDSALKRQPARDFARRLQAGPSVQVGPGAPWRAEIAAVDSFAVVELLPDPEMQGVI